MSPIAVSSRRRKRQVSVKSFFVPAERQSATSALAVESTGIRDDSLLTENEILKSAPALLRESLPPPLPFPQAGVAARPPNMSFPPSIPLSSTDQEEKVDADALDATSSPSSSSFIPSPPSESETVATTSRHKAPCTPFSIHCLPSVSIAPSHASLGFTFNIPFEPIKLPKEPVKAPPAGSSINDSADDPVNGVIPQSLSSVFISEVQSDATATEQPLKQPTVVEKFMSSSVEAAASSGSVELNELISEDVAEKKKSIRKRRRSKGWPVCRERPCTRASLQQMRSLSPPPAVENMVVDECSTKDSAQILSPYTPPSRLNRARNIARRAASLTQGHLNVDTSNNAQSVVVVIGDKDGNANSGCEGDNEIAEVVSVVPQAKLLDTTLIEPVVSSSSSGSAAASPTLTTSPSPGSSKKRSLHPFFAATAAAVTSSRDKSKVPRLQGVLCDAWSCPSATIHVNGLPPQSVSPTKGISVSGPTHKGSPVPIRQKTAREILSSSTLKFSYYPSEIGQVSSSSVDSMRSKIVGHVSSHPDAWVDRYRADHRIDVINAAITDELTDWLRTWYGNRRSLGDSDDEMSLLAELDDASEERERVAIITGPVGCGKSTVVAAAARKLGLSVLEINAGVCRTGRRVREIIGEALRTHRVIHGKVATGGSGCIIGHSPCGTLSSFNGKAKTLILFEEVDELQADEKGFWASVLELASSDDCKRPIVCTANSFTAAMRQVFPEQKIGARCDFDRLLVGTKEEGLLNETPFRHIPFADIRSERQSLSVLLRIAHSEKLSINDSLHEYLAALNRSDIRRSINELHFWASRGQVNPTDDENGESLKREDINLLTPKLRYDKIKINSDIEIARMLFAQGSSNFCSDYQPTAETQLHEGSLQTLETWASSLELMSVADTMFYSRDCETVKRSVESRLAPDAINLDDDLLNLSHTADDISMESVSFSREHLSKPIERNRLQDVSSTVHQHRSQFVSLLPPVVPRARRPALMDYLPTLISMVRVEEIRKNSGINCITEQSRHRTRSRTKRSGLSALNLNSATLTLLKKASIAPQST